MFRIELRVGLAYTLGRRPQNCLLDQKSGRKSTDFLPDLFAFATYFEKMQICVVHGDPFGTGNAEKAVAEAVKSQLWQMFFAR